MSEMRYQCPRCGRIWQNEFPCDNTDDCGKDALIPVAVIQQAEYDALLRLKAAVEEDEKLACDIALHYVSNQYGCDTADHAIDDYRTALRARGGVK